MSARPPRETLRQRAQAIPLVEGGDVLAEADTLAILRDVEQQGSVLPEHLRKQRTLILAAMLPELEPVIEGKSYAVDNAMLFALVTRSLQRGAAQAVSDIGQPLADNQIIEALVMGPAVADTPPAT